jgi:hypothetical protein
VELVTRPSLYRHLHNLIALLSVAGSNATGASPGRLRSMEHSWRWAEGVLWRLIVDGVVVLAPPMDAPASMRGLLVDDIWLALAQGGRPSEIAAALSDEIEADLHEEVDRALVLSHVETAVSGLGSVGALVEEQG